MLALEKFTKWLNRPDSKFPLNSLRRNLINFVFYLMRKVKINKLTASKNRRLNNKNLLKAVTEDVKDTMDPVTVDANGEEDKDKVCLQTS